MGWRWRHAAGNLVLEIDRIPILVSTTPLVSELAQKLLQRQHVWIEKLFEVATRVLRAPTWIETWKTLRIAATIVLEHLSKLAKNVG